MRPRDVIETLVALLPSKRAVFLWGPPGVGKDDLTHQAGARLGLPVLDWRLLYRDPVDVRGLPSIKEGMTVWNVPSDFPTRGKGILFLNELPQAPPATQQVAAQIALERRVGEHPLGEDWVVVSAGNRQEDRAGAQRVATNLLNRFIHLDVEVSLEDWQGWAIGKEISPLIRGFLNFRPGLLHAFDTTVSQRAFPSPRSWAFVHDVLGLTPEPLLLDVLAGTVGPGAAGEFLSYYQNHKDIPDLAQVLASPATAPVPTQTSVLYAFCAALAEKLRGPKPPLAAYAQYVLRLPKTFTALALREGILVCRALINDKRVEGWCRDNKQLLNP